MTEQLEVLKNIVTRLDEVGIPYMVSGSVAMNYYALPRMTRDIDLVVELRQGDVAKLERVLADEYYFSPEAVTAAVARRTMCNLIHQGFLVKVDCIVRKDTQYRRLEFSRRRWSEVPGVSFHIVAPEDLILSKLDWARESRSELQLGDVRNLIEAVADLGCEAGTVRPFGRGDAVNDTTPEAARVYRELLMSRPNAERLRMGCEMFETAKALALAGLRERGEERLEERLFLRLYSSDFAPEDRARILEQIRTRPVTRDS